MDTSTTPAQPTTAEAFDALVKDREEHLDALQATLTQRDWLLVTRALDLTRADVIQDGGFRLAALAWVKTVREHGGASWDRFLNMTDDALLEFHGFPTGDRPDEDQAPAGEPDYAADVTPPAYAGPGAEGDPHRP